MQKLEVSAASSNVQLVIPLKSSAEYLPITMFSSHRGSQVGDPKTVALQSVTSFDSVAMFILYMCKIDNACVCRFFHLVTLIFPPCSLPAVSQFRQSVMSCHSAAEDIGKEQHLSTL